jgi:antitoxin VapB
MTDRARVFRNGGSQAVRLPKECRVADGTVLIARREGRRIVLEPADEWPETFSACLGAWKEPIERPEQTPLKVARDPFDR